MTRFIQYLCFIFWILTLSLDDGSSWKATAFMWIGTLLLTALLVRLVAGGDRADHQN
jgi:hypothetical protein